MYVRCIYVGDHLIMHQLLSSSKLNTNLHLDSITILNRTEYMLNLSRIIFRDVSILLSQICDFDLSITAVNNSRGGRNDSSDWRLYISGGKGEFTLKGGNVRETKIPSGMNKFNSIGV
jgi:hypothetical protein